MLETLIRISIRHRFLVLAAGLLLLVFGANAVRHLELDALPDLSDTQVVVRVMSQGLSPQRVEDQVTYPISNALLTVPGAETVRGFSMFGDAFLYVLFKDGTDPYWARSRVLEALAQATPRLPAGVQVQVGPDATGVGWIFQYALTDRSGRHDLAQLRSLQDWFLKYELKTVPGVAEVASLGGMVRQYQVVIDPERLRGLMIPLDKVREAIRMANQEAGGAVMEIAEAEYVIHSRGLLRNIDDLRRIPLGGSHVTGAPVVLEDVASIRIGPEPRRGLAELDSKGEVVGGIVVMRQGENALAVARAVQAKLATLSRSLPEGVEVVTTYNRSGVIERAIDNLSRRLVEEFLVVAVVCLAFLWHFRSTLLVIATLPLSVLGAALVMRHQGIDINIMSLGGIAIAVGTLVDAAIVLVENVHKRLEKQADGADRIEAIARAAVEVAPPIFFSLLIITVSFLPVLALGGEEGKLFAPLAYAKTYAMAVAAALSVTLVPALLAFMIKGRIAPEQANPLNRLLHALYRPVLRTALTRPRTVLLLALVATLSAAWPLSRLGSEFMPELDEGDLLYMPMTLPSISIAKARAVLQQTNRIIASVPEVAMVFGKAGRAETATDPAPLEMIETTIQLKPRDEWRPGLTLQALREELDAKLRIPGLSNTWTQPIRNRIDMQATGARTPVAVRVTGPDAARAESLAVEVEKVLRQLPGVASASAERQGRGRTIEIEIDRAAAARLELSVADVQQVIDAALGGMAVTEVLEGRERYGVSLRFPREYRDGIAGLRTLPVVSHNGAVVALEKIARLRVVDGPAMLRSENARPAAWVYVDVSETSPAALVAEAEKAVAAVVTLPAGYALEWTGRYRQWDEAQERLRQIVPAVLVGIVILIYLAFRRAAHVWMLLLSLPLALAGSAWFLHWLDYRLSVAVWVGLIALAGVAVETAILMLIYLEQAYAARLDAARAAGWPLAPHEIREAVEEGALQRLRPKIMTVTVIIAGLLPIMLGEGTGGEVMRRIAAPMLGGIVSAAALTLLVIPALYYLWRIREAETAPIESTE